MKDSNQKTNIKPPDLWIHHDQMELKALEKSSLNGEASTSGVTSNTLPRSGNSEYSQDNVHGNSSSLDKRTYVPSYMGKSREGPRPPHCRRSNTIAPRDTRKLAELIAICFVDLLEREQHDPFVAHILIISPDI